MVNNLNDMKPIHKIIPSRTEVQVQLLQQLYFTHHQSFAVKQCNYNCNCMKLMHRLKSHLDSCNSNNAAMVQKHKAKHYQSQ